jgi:hypothetical protein
VRAPTDADFGTDNAERADLDFIVQLGERADSRGGFYVGGHEGSGFEVQVERGQRVRLKRFCGGILRGGLRGGGI